MSADLALLDRTIDAGIKRLETSEVIPASIEKDIQEKSKKNIAGFRVFDAEHAESMKVKHIKERRESLARFYKDRAAAIAKAEAAGVMPMAVLPSTAWAEICNRADLFRLSPDAQNRVPIKVDPIRRHSADPLRRHSAEYYFEDYAKNNWKAFLKEIFGRGTINDRWGTMQATLVLPTPPADVQQVLIKSQNIGALMHVAAVAEAIGFQESFQQLWDRQVALKQEEQRYQDWLKNDPIIYFEEGCATAIIAQFGDFPVERKVMEDIADSEYLIPHAEIKAANNMWYAVPPDVLPDVALEARIRSGMGVGEAQAIGALIMPMQPLHPTAISKL